MLLKRRGSKANVWPFHYFWLLVISKTPLLGSREGIKINSICPCLSVAPPSATSGNHLQTGCFSFYFFPTPVSLTLCSQIDLHPLLSTFLRSLTARRAPVVRCFHPHQVEALLSGFHCRPGPGCTYSATRLLVFCPPRFQSLLLGLLLLQC